MADDLLGKLGEAFVLLRADGSKLPADLAKQKAEIEKQIDDVGKKLKGTGTLLTAGVTAPILAIGAAAIGSWRAIDEGLDLIRTKTGLTGDALKGLEADFAGVFANVPDDAATVGAALGDVYARTGLTGDGLQTLTTQLLDLSRVTGTDVSDNVGKATRLFGDWSIASKDQGAALDFVFKTAQATGSSVSGLMEKVVQFGAPLRQFNFSFEESVALLGKWEKEGVNSELVLGSLRIAMGKFASENIPLRAGLEATQKAILDLGPGSAATAKAMEIFGARAGPDMAAAILEGRFAVDDLLKTIKGSKDTISAAANDTKDFGSRWAEFQNKLELALEPLGGKLMSIAESAIPLLEKLASGVGALAGFFNDLPAPVQDAALVLGGLAAAAGPVILVAGTMVSKWKSCLDLWTTSSDTVPTLSSKMPGLASGLGLVAKGASVVAVAFAGWEFGKWLGGANSDGSTGISENIQVLILKLQGLTDAQIADTIMAQRHADAINSQKKPTDDVAAATASLQAEIDRLTGKTKGAAGETDVLAGKFGGAKTKAQEYREEVAKLAAEMGGAGLIRQGLQTAEALGKIGSLTKLTKEETERYNKVLDETITKMRLMGQAGTAEFKKVAEAWLKTNESIMAGRVSSDPFSILKSLPGTGSGPLGAAPPIPLKFESVDIKTILGLTPGFKLTPPPEFFQPFGASFKAAFTGKGGFLETIGPALTQTIIGAFQNGANRTEMGQAIGATIGGGLGQSLTKSLLGSTVGKGLGKVVGGFLGPIGSLLGGKLGGIIGGLGVNKTKGSRADLAEALGFGDLDGLYKDLQKLGPEGAKLADIGLNVIGRKDEAGNRKWMDDVKKFYDDVAAKKTKDLQDTADAQDRLQNAIQKYGFSIEELGPKWRAQRLTEQAQELVLDFTALTASGIDVDVVLGKMGASINEFVAMALKTGTEIPESMRPMLERMAEMGTLTDENGNLITDLEGSGIKFSKSMTEGFESIVSKLDELIRKLTGDLTDGLNNLPSPTVTVGVEYDYGDGPAPPAGGSGRTGGSGGGPVGLSDGGFADWGAGTPAILHGPEVVMPIDRLAEMMSGGGGGLTAEGLVAALQAAGMDRPNVTIAPQFQGAIANEYYSFAAMLLPVITRVLQDNGTLRGAMASTLSVG